MKRVVVALPMVILLVMLAGCSATPSRDEIGDRFMIEFTDSTSIRDGLEDFGLQMADDALDGNCGSTAYESGLAKNGDENLVYAWRVTCMTYFEDDLSTAQIEDTKQMVLDRAVSNLEESD